MKTINVTFEDQEHKELTELKNKSSWRKFILSLCGIKKQRWKQMIDIDYIKNYPLANGDWAILYKGVKQWVLRKDWK